jgi:NADH-quinone oxidoreductase subunit L
MENPEMGKKLKEQFSLFWKISYNKYYVDEIYDYSVIKPIMKGSYYFLFRFVDVLIIDGFMNGLAWLNSAVGKLLRRLQNGAVSTYMFYFVSGALAVVVYAMLICLGGFSQISLHYNTIVLSFGIAFGAFILLVSLLMGIMEK